jgi:D-tyrosyl-tRNA(Tyr) deacylase
VVPSNAGRFHIAYIVVQRRNVKAVVQRVSGARVRVGERTAGEIGPGLCILLGVARGDEQADAKRLAAKVARLRIFENDDGRFDHSLLDTGGEALVVSQFTLIADTAKGNGPSFTDAAQPEEAEPVYHAFCEALRDLGVDVATGEFGARMAVELVNDGPVTIILEGGRPRPREAEAAEEDP